MVWSKLRNRRSKGRGKKALKIKNGYIGLFIKAKTHR